jgi:protein phosphatase
MLSARTAARAVLAAYAPLFELDLSGCEEVGVTAPIPTFSEEPILRICEVARNQMERLPIVLNLCPPFYVIGDIHGNIFDLVRILRLTLRPPQSRLLFLGDYVDRGEYSIEVVTLLFSLMILYPNHVVLLRGNHEFLTVNTTYGFYSDVLAQYQSPKLYEAMNTAFLYMPLVAILNSEVFCVHGGIAPTLTSIDRIRTIKRPLFSHEGPIVVDLLWSDPNSECKRYSLSSRGFGVEFGHNALNEFLERMRLKLVVRAHQCAQAGISKFGDDKLYTVFSCSNYEGETNRCGLLFLDAELKPELFSLPPLEQIPRSKVLTKAISAEDILKHVQVPDAATLKQLEVERSRLRSTLSRRAKLAKSNDTLLAVVVSAGLSRPRRILIPLKNQPQYTVPILPELKSSARRRGTSPLDESIAELSSSDDSFDNSP